MSKTIVGVILLIVLLFTATVVADITTSDIRFNTVRPEEDLARLLRSKFAQHNTDMANLGTPLGTGEVFYVDSNVTTAGTGDTVTGALATVDEAIDLCTDNRGDIIYVLQGHAETFTAADGFDADVAGITIIGLGNGADRPEFTFNHADATVAVGAANVTVANCRFLTTITAVTLGIAVEAGGDNFTLINCTFPEPATSTSEFVDAIDLASGADGVTVDNCEYSNYGAAGADHFLEAGNGANLNLTVTNCRIIGDFAVSAIWSDTADLDVFIVGNQITNNNADDHCIEFTGNATGICAYNSLFTNAEGTTLDPGSAIYCFENYVSTAADVSGMIIPVHDDGTTQLNATSVTAIATAVDALAGIGMIGLCDTNVTTTTVDSAALGGFGNDAFLEGWSLVCIFDTGGAVGTEPSGQVRDITDYVSTGGVFTTAAWDAALTAGDYVLLTPTHLIPAHWDGNGPTIIYCDDGGSNGEGTSWETAKTTFIAAEAIANPGDTIMVGENHNENWTQAAQPTLNVAGVTVIGMGEGDSRPLFDFDGNTTLLFTIDAAGCTIKNLRFRPGATVIAVGLRIEDAALGCTVENCAWEVGEASGDEFIDSISVDAAAEGLTIKNCTSWNANATAGDQNTWLNLDEATIDDCSVIGNTVFGTFDEACIWWGAAVPVNLLVKDNVLTNSTSGQLCIEGSGAATGMCVGNMMYSDTLGAVLDPGSMTCIENYAATAIDQSAVLVPRPDTIAGKTYATVMQATAMDDNLFDVDGGGILITSFVGVITTNIVNAAGSLEIKLDADAGWVDYDFSTAVDLDNDQAGQRIVFSDANESVLTPLAAADNGATILMSGWHCGEGMIEQDNTDEDATGAIKWFMTWIPYEDGTTVTAQ